MDDAVSLAPWLAIAACRFSGPARPVPIGSVRLLVRPSRL